MEGRIRRIRKEVVGCIQAVVVKYKFLFQFEDIQQRDMGNFLLTHICSEEEVFHEVNEPIFIL